MLAEDKPKRTTKNALGSTGFRLLQIVAALTTAIPVAHVLLNQGSPASPTTGPLTTNPLTTTPPSGPGVTAFGFTIDLADIVGAVSGLGVAAAFDLLRAVTTEINKNANKLYGDFTATTYFPPRTNSPLDDDVGYSRAQRAVIWTGKELLQYAVMFILILAFTELGDAKAKDQLGQKTFNIGSIEADVKVAFGIFMTVGLLALAGADYISQRAVEQFIRFMNFVANKCCKPSGYQILDDSTIRPLVADTSATGSIPVYQTPPNYGSTST